MPKLVSHIKHDSLTSHALHFFTMAQSLKSPVAFVLRHICEQYSYPRSPLSPTHPAYVYVSVILERNHMVATSGPFFDSHFIYSHPPPPLPSRRDLLWLQNLSPKYTSHYQLCSLIILLIPQSWQILHGLSVRAPKNGLRALASRPLPSFIAKTSPASRSLKLSCVSQL